MKICVDQNKREHNLEKSLLKDHQRMFIFGIEICVGSTNNNLSGEGATNTHISHAIKINLFPDNILFQLLSYLDIPYNYRITIGI